MARRYDEWPGESYEGSSARGAMKGFVRHGVCLAKTWSDKLKGCLRSIGTDGDNEQIYVGAQEGTVYAYTPPVVASGSAC